jgi:hypothetical protein
LSIEDEGFLWHEALAKSVLLPGDFVAIEGLSFGSIGRSHLLSGVHAIWRKELYSIVDTILIPVPLRVKIWAVDNAKASKSDMIKWGKTYLGLSKKDKLQEHEADALSLALIAKGAYEVVKSLPLSITLRQEQTLQNNKQNGTLQNSNSFYRGRNGERSTIINT